MSRLQDAINAYSEEYQRAHVGAKPPQDHLFDGTFSRHSGQSFCLCFKVFTGLGAMIDFTGLTCAGCMKPVTAEAQAWADEARAERASRK